MKAQKANMKGNEGPKGKNERKAKNWKLEPGPALLNSLYGTLGKRAVFGNLWGGGGGGPQKLATKKPKCKEMKAQNAKMKGNKAPQG